MIFQVKLLWPHERGALRVCILDGRTKDGVTLQAVVDSWEEVTDIHPQWYMLERLVNSRNREASVIP